MSRPGNDTAACPRRLQLPLPRQAGAHDRIGAQDALAGRPIQRQHDHIDRHLLNSVHPDQRLCNAGIDIIHSLGDALAQIALWSPSRSSSASCVPVDTPEGTIARPNCHPKNNFHFHSGIASRVEYFNCFD